MHYFVANWKQHFITKGVQDWLDNFQYELRPDRTVILAGGYTNLPYLKEKQSSYQIAAQNVSVHFQGPFTGQVGAPQLQEFVEYCILGHSEVRKEFGDTDQIVATKAKLLGSAGITPIICLDLPYIDSQITFLKNELLDLENLIFAYEPLAAVGTGKPENPTRANEIAFKIKHLTSSSFPVLYGGSVTVDNALDFLSQEHLDGFLIGAASLDPVNFAKIVNCAPTS